MEGGEREGEREERREEGRREGREDRHPPIVETWLYAHGGRCIPLRPHGMATPTSKTSACWSLKSLVKHIFVGLNVWFLGPVYSTRPAQFTRSSFHCLELAADTPALRPPVAVDSSEIVEGPPLHSGQHVNLWERYIFRVYDLELWTVYFDDISPTV